MAVSDWDFELTTAAKTLDASLYVTSPTSLKIAFTGGDVHHVGCLSRLTDAQNLPQGQLVTYVRRSSNPCGIGVSFRNQAALGSPAFADCYYCFHNTTSCLFYRRVAGVDKSLGFISATCPNGTWCRFRYTFWNGENLSGNPALCVRLEKWDGVSAWVIQGTVFDTNNQWQASSINRVGPVLYGGGTQWGNWDDTQIWIPV